MKDIIDFLKLPAYLLGALAVASGILLFSSDEIIKKLYMADFRDKYGFVIGIVFVVSVSILCILLIKKIYGIISHKHNSKKLKDEQEKFLLRIKGEKVELIAAFLSQHTHTMMLPMHDGLVIELQHYNVITPAGQTHLVSMLNPQITFFLQPWVRERIESNEELKQKFNID